MSLVSSMYTAANGLQAHSDAMNIVSDNIANVSTVGFKSSMARLTDLVATSAANTPVGSDLGQGCTVSGVEVSFTQGALLSTGAATDLSLLGDGFFIVKGSYNGDNGSYYTRAGQFYLDVSGQLVNPFGLVAQGYNADSSGNISDTLGNLQLSTTSLIAPSPTANVVMSANLNSNSTTITEAFSPTSPTTTSTFSTSVSVIDSRGEEHNVDIYFAAAGYNNVTGYDVFDWYAVANGAEITGGTSGTPSVVGSGTLSFTNTGALHTTTGSAVTLNFIGAVQSQVINFDFGNSIENGGTGLVGTTSYATTSTVSSISSDGFSPGTVAGITVSADGTVIGNYSNGISQAIGQLAIAKFVNNQGLTRVGGTLYTQSLDSGDPAIGVAGVAGRGSISSGSLEQSNTNLSQEFINLISFERGYQANTRSIHSSDQMLQELLSIV